MGKVSLSDLLDIWSNGACLGYAIRALEALAYDPKEIAAIIDAMKMQLDLIDVKQADKHYCNSPY